jgi:small-conductance mechanosensitive channel
MATENPNAVGKSITEAAEGSTSVLTQSFVDMWNRIVEHGPNVVAAIVILVVGYFISKFAARAIAALCERIGLQRGAERGGLAESMKQVGIQRTVPQIVGTIFFWLIMCVFLMASLNVLGLERVSTTMEEMVKYIPKILFATVMVVVGLLIAALLRGLIATSADRAGLSYAQQLASGVYYVVVLITLLVVVQQLGVDVQLIHNLVLIAAGSLAVGFALAFGFGGRDVVGGILAGYYIRQRMQAGDLVRLADMEGTVRDVGPVATIVETEEDGLVHRHSIPNVRMLNEAIR